MSDSIDAFRQDLLVGFGQNPKTISSKYFYDDRGDALFQQIMEMPAYYLSRAEDAVLQIHSDELARQLNTGPIELLELGAGDGRKTQKLLQAMDQFGVDVHYRPLDISPGILAELQKRLAAELPHLHCAPFAGDYWSDFPERTEGRQRHILFLGSNLGNYPRHVEERFLDRLQRLTLKGDRLVLGLDLVKDPEEILRAYDDPKGITREFNLNLLHRINRELHGNFDPGFFRHWAVYDPLEQEARSYLVSTRKAEYTIDEGRHSFAFDAWEAIHVETSRKYRLEGLSEGAHAHGFRMLGQFTDREERFADVIWERL